MKSLTGRFASARGWALLLTLFFGAGLLIAACGDETAPPPTTPAPPPAPPPAPEPPAVPTGLQVSASGADFIEWSWTAVEGATGYEVQLSLDGTFTDEDPIIAVEGTSFRNPATAPVPAGVTAYLRVRAVKGEGDAKLTSAWSARATGMTADPRPAAPTGLRVSGSGDDYIEWTWSQVEGASGYQAQFSTGPVFGEAAAIFNLTGVANTTHRVSNLDASSTGYLRVRAYTGTAAEPVVGEWSEVSSGTTERPRPPEPLSSPTGVAGASSDSDSITLTWDAVDGADRYEVQQRTGGGAWTDASCGGAGNEVDEEECVATGLDEGTAYEFRVRAVPASSDARSAASAWTQTDTTVSTTGSTGPTTPGGAGNLNVTWQSTDNSITWIWDRIPGAAYDYAAFDVDYNDSPNPCAGRTFAFAGSPNTAHTATVSARGEPRLLCVKTSNPQNTVENLSFAWGVTTPVAPGAGAATHSAERRTTAINWGGIEQKAGFDWDIRLAADPERENGISASTSAANVQRACEAGAFVEGGDTDVNLSGLEVSVTTGLDPYTGYLLCLKYANQQGQTSWAVPASNAEVATLPAAPPSPRINASRTAETASSTAVVWELAVRNLTNVPRTDAGFDAKVVGYRERWNDNGTGRSVRTPTRAACDRSAGRSGEGTNEDWSVSENVSLSPTSQGIVAQRSIDRPDAGGSPNLGNLRVHLCIRAKSGAGTGPWVLSSSYTVRQRSSQ